MNIFAPDGLSASGLPGNWTSYAFDPQGSVAQRLNSSQAITSSSYYDEYGQEYTSGSPSDPFAYNAQSGYYLDRQTGKYLLGHRYYDWSAGRFITRDPIGPAGGINLYGYCQSSPVGRADPSGGVPEPSYFLNWDYYRQHPLADPTKGWFGRDRFYYYTRDDGNTAIHWPGMDEPVESCGLDDDGQRGSWAILLGIGRKPTAVLRNGWERLYGYQWPTDPETGLPMEAHHIRPLADGGADTAENIMPLPRRLHRQIHLENGDWRRWLKRRFGTGIGESEGEGAGDYEGDR